MVVADINPYDTSVLSYKIVLDPKKDKTSYEDRLERWVEGNPLLSLVATAFLVVSIRYVVLMASTNVNVINSILQMFSRHVYGQCTCFHGVECETHGWNQSNET